MANNYFKDSTEVVLENYESFLENNMDSVNSTNRITDLLSMDNNFNSFTESLMHGNNNPITTNSAIYENVRKILNRERQMILEDMGVGLPPSAGAAGWFVNLFPILTDIYSDPILNKIATTHISKTPVFSFTRMFMESTVQNSDGTTTTKKFPTVQDTIRGKEQVVTLYPNKNNNLFGASTVSLDNRNSSINKSFFHIFELTITDNDDGTGVIGVGTNTHIMPVTIRQTGNASTPYTFEFKSGPDPLPGVADTRQTVQGSVLGQVNWDNGSYTYSITFQNLDNPVSTITYTTVSAKCKVFYTSKKSNTNRIDVEIKQFPWEVSIDVREDFRIPLHAETLQDWQSIYNIEMLRTMVLGIKTQILLNKDRDLSYMLQMYEPEMKKYRNNSVCDLSIYQDGGGVISPSSLQGIFRNIMTSITKTNSMINRNMRALPQYLVCGPATFAVLKNLQSVVFNPKDNNNGSMGFGEQGTVTFGNQEVIMSDAVPSNKIYHIYKPASDDLSRSVILDIVHKPLYIIEETSEANKYTYLRSRSTLEILTPWALGVTELKGHEKYFGDL